MSDKFVTRKARRQAARERGRHAPREKPTRRSKAHWLWAGALALVVALGVIALVRHEGSRSGTSGTQLAIGSSAPAGTFTDLQGHTVSLAAFHGKPTLLWFVTTWCSSCQAGTQTMAQHIEQLRADGVKVVELELYHNLGGSGPSVRNLATTYAGKASHNTDWTWGMASQQMSYRYDPKGYLDIYYLVDAQGHIRYINGAPASSVGDLLRAASQV